MRRNASTSNCIMRNKFGFTSTKGLSQVPANQQLQTYTEHYGGKWVGKKRYFLNMPIYTYKSLGSVGHIMVCKPTKLSTDTTAIKFTVAEPLWSTLYEKRCELENFSGSVIMMPLRHFRKTFLDEAFIQNAKSFWRTLPTPTFPLSFTVGDGSHCVTSRSPVLSCLSRSSTPICTGLIGQYLFSSLVFEVCAFPSHRSLLRMCFGSLG